MKISIYINKYNCLIFLDVILKYYKDYLDNDVIEWNFFKGYFKYFCSIITYSEQKRK